MNREFIEQSHGLVRDPNENDVGVAARTEGCSRRLFLKCALGMAAPLVSATLFLPVVTPLSAFAAALDLPRHPLPVRKPTPPRILTLDPGHGGNDPGAIGYNGTFEKNVTLDIARRMAEAFEKVASVQTVLTRDSDVYLPLKERVKISEQARSDLFVSIHADSAPNKQARGLSVYTLSAKASDSLAGQIADRENHVDVSGGMDMGVDDQQVAAILYDLTARRTRNTAQRTKQGFVRAIGKEMRLLESPMRSANFVVLRAPDVPSLLIETGFLSNPQDEAILREAKQRQNIAENMAKVFQALLESSLFG